jgi:hypothetical protein
VFGIKPEAHKASLSAAADLVVIDEPHPPKRAQRPARQGAARPPD